MAISMDKLVQLYRDNIMRLYGTLVPIVSDKDAKLIARVCKEFQLVVGTKFTFSIAFHPQTGG